MDQRLNEVYSCPTCRKPLFLGRTENEANSCTGEVLSDEQFARQINSGLDRQNMPGHTLPAGVFPNQMQNPVEGSPWRFGSFKLVSLACLEITVCCTFYLNDHLIEKLVLKYETFTPSVLIITGILFFCCAFIDC